MHPRLSQAFKQISLYQTPLLSTTNSYLSTRFVQKLVKIQFRNQISLKIATLFAKREQSYVDTLQNHFDCNIKSSTKTLMFNNLKV